MMMNNQQSLIPMGTLTNWNTNEKTGIFCFRSICIDEILLHYSVFVTRIIITCRWSRILKLFFKTSHCSGHQHTPPFLWCDCHHGVVRSSFLEKEEKPKIFKALYSDDNGWLVGCGGWMVIGLSNTVHQQGWCFSSRQKYRWIVLPSQRHHKQNKVIGNLPNMDHCHAMDSSKHDDYFLRAFFFG